MILTQRSWYIDQSAKRFSEYMFCFVLTLIISITRYTVHGRGAKHGSVEHIISVWVHSRPVSNGDSFKSVFSRMPSLSHPKKSFLSTFFFVTPPTSVQNSAIFAPFTKGKSHRPLFALFFQKCHFFPSKKGSPNRPVPLANSINGHPVFGSRKINGSNYRKDLQ